MISHNTFEGIQMAGILEHFFLDGDLGGAEHAFSRSGEDPDLNIALVVDEKGAILLSTRYVLKGRHISEIMPEAPADLIKISREKMSKMDQIIKDGSAHCIAFPIRIGVKSSEVRPSRIGVLYLEHDLSNSKKLGYAQGVEKFIEFTIILGVVCLSLCVFLVVFFTRRVDYLVNYSRQLADGKFHHEIKINGSDELAHLGRSFKVMAEKINKYTRMLRESEEHYRTLVQNVPGIVYRRSSGLSDWSMEFISDAVAEISGYPASDFTNNRVRSYASLIHPDDRNRINREIQEACRERRPYVIEYRLLPSNGGIRWIYEKGQGIFNKEESLLCLDGAIFDVTEGKRTEECIAKLNTAFLSLGSDYYTNIQNITKACGETLGATCALYNRLDRGMLCAIGQWQTPKDFDPKDKPEGHICYDLIKIGKEGGIHAIRNLQKTNYFKTDPNVARYGLQTYMGHAVECNKKPVGALCAVFQTDVALGKNEKMVLEVLAKALDNEEERGLKQEELKRTQNASLNIMADLDRQRNKLSQSLQEKEVLLREIHHRVKNNMQVMCSLLRLRSKNVEDKKTRQIFKESESCIKSMAMVHERLYKTEDLNRINFHEYINDLAHNIHRSYGLRDNPVDLKVAVEDIHLNIETAVSCGLLINELISNSLKHGFPGNRKGQVIIEMRRLESRMGKKKDGMQRMDSEKGKVVMEDGKGGVREESPIANHKSSIELVVRDNGVGFPEDLALENTKSLGLNLVNILAKQIRGEIEFNQEGGTEWKVRFKEKAKTSPDL